MVLLSVEQKEQLTDSVLCVEMTAGEFRLLRQALEFTAYNGRTFRLDQIRDLAGLALFAKQDWDKFQSLRDEWLLSRFD